MEHPELYALFFVAVCFLLYTALTDKGKGEDFDHIIRTVLSMSFIDLDAALKKLKKF